MKPTLMDRISKLKNKQNITDPQVDLDQTIVSQKVDLDQTIVSSSEDPTLQRGLMHQAEAAADRKQNLEKVKARSSTDDHSGREETRALEKEWKNIIYSSLLEEIDLAVLSSLPEDQARKQIRQLGFELIAEKNPPLSQSSRAKVVRALENEVLGLGPLEELLADPTISDILINGAHSTYVERRGVLMKAELSFNDDAHLMRIIDKIVSSVGRRIDESSPMVDARLKDGSRVNVIIPPLALDGPTMSIRRFAVERLGVKDLVKYGSLTQDIADVLQAAVILGLNILISGGTGSGKTTLLNILSAFIPKDERIVTIEDSAELQLQQEHVVRLETRPANTEGRGEYTQRDLVKNSLRMRPDRIVIGEVRSVEAFDMLQAMNTGHDGSLATVHANTPRDALARVENMVAMGGFNLPDKVVREQIASAINLVVQIERLEDGSRRMTSVQEVVGMEGTVITTSEIFKFVRQGVDENGRVLGRHVATGVVPRFYARLKPRGIALDIAIFSRMGNG